MKKTLWDLFVATGNTGYYTLYKRIDEDGNKNKGSNHKDDRPQG